jgi:colicin import membrane protein
MIRPARPQRENGALGVMVCWSAVAHLAVFLFVLTFHFPSRYKEAPTYYVELTNLPVASPQAGMPTGTPGETKAAPAPQQPPPPAPREMTLPAKPAGKSAAKAKTAPAPKKTEESETTQEFEERLARLQKAADARHTSNAIEAMRKRGAGRGPAGMPGATGTEAGSDYASYIKSRLEEEFLATIAYQSSNPELVLKLTIGPNGRIQQRQVIKSSRDRLFEDSVFRTIVKAEKNFRPPPGGGPFEIEVKFSPQGVKK